MNVLVSKKGLLLQASAGNGKTYTAKMIAKSLGKGVKILAPTNKAALNIGGSTIHKFLKMTKEGYISPKLLKIVKERYQYIIVDEISMITKDLWKRLCLLKQETDITFLLLGDEKQCPPVEDEKIDDYFNHPAVKYICNYNKNVLDVRKRYDEKLYNVLEDVDSVNVDEFQYRETPRNICYYNRTRIHVNKLWNDKLKKDGDLFIPENVLDEYTQDMYVYEGMPIIAKKTKHDGDGLLFANSETFTIGDIDAEYISMYNERPDENGEKEMYVYACPISEFREYFLMNYCSTTHKSQGETIVENFTIYDWKAMCKKIKYTALSRAKCVEQVCFGKVDFKAVCPDTFATNIDKKIKAHKEFDTLKKYENNIDVKGIQKLFVKQNGECVKCGCSMKTCGYAKGDKEQFSIDRIDSKQGHIKGNVQLMCWGCNRAKKNRF
jgi:ATP-dependent exoDNAse (exonuclease V) alpha subunit